MEAHHSTSTTCSMSFLQTWASDRNHRAEHELLTTHIVHEALLQADCVVVHLGGKAGRLGEGVVSTALLEGTLQALSFAGKVGTFVHIIIDAGLAALFDEQLYQEKYWPEITITFSDQSSSIQATLVSEVINQHILVLDFHGANDGLPTLQIEEGDMLSTEDMSKVTLVTQLFRVAVRDYAQRGPVRRYADFIEDLFALPAASIDGALVQPCILLTDAENVRYQFLATDFALDPAALQIMCFFQSVVLAKCYERWDEVLQLFCTYVAAHDPGQKIDFLLACGPDADLPEGFKKADMAEWLQDFTGVNGNTRVLVRSTSSLRDLALLTSHAALALSDDTGGSHIAGALGIPTVTIYLPGNIYAQHIWSSSLWHHGVTLEPNPFSYQQLVAAVTWGNTALINRIAPEDICDAITQVLPSR